MGIKQKALRLVTGFLKNGIRVIGGNKATAISAQLAEDLSPTLTQKTDFGAIKFFCPGRLPESRARTLLTKEPETIEWINTFDNADVLWDIGANVGVYSLYAASRGITVLAFEPSPSNYYLLSRNVEINKMDDTISAICIAFSETSALDSFYMANTELGGAMNSFAEPIDWQGKPFAACHKQAMLGFSVDDFIKQFNPPFPNHIKIDVDGAEDRIIRGARKTLTDKRVKSILVELDASQKDYCNGVIKIIESSGMHFYQKKHAPQFDTGKFSLVYNYIFKRDDS